MFILSFGVWEFVVEYLDIQDNKPGKEEMWLNVSGLIFEERGNRFMVLSYIATIYEVSTLKSG